MSFSRRTLPPIHMLAAFEAVARLESITRAAGELDLTQGAVSRQILNLEAHLGVALFERHKKRLHLTRQGAAYLHKVQPALEEIAMATVSLTANPDGGVLNLGILPTFGTQWLAPRLSAFLAAHPGITVNLTTHLESFDLRTSEQDAAIFFGQTDDWPGCDSLKLLDEHVVPACAPEVAERHGFTDPQDVMRAPLLFIATRRDAFAQWLEGHGVADEVPRGMVFDQFATLAQAAKHGLGVAMLPLFLIAEDLRRGTLVSAYGPPVPAAGGYYLVWPTSRQDYAPIQRLSRWLREHGQVDPTAAL